MCLVKYVIRLETLLNKISFPDSPWIMDHSKTTLIRFQSSDSIKNDDENLNVSSLHQSKKSTSGLKKSAAGLCVGVGSFTDPEELPGLAHFLEHMVN